MIRLNADHIDAIRRHGEADFPHECCGLMIGSLEGASDGAPGVKVVHEIFPISNAREEAAKRNRFLITPQEVMRGELHARKQGRDVIGFYHSHPDCPAIPSQFDLDHAWPVYSYVIVSILKGKADALLSWELRPDRSKFDPEEIVKGP
jgi:proteasome lid subunit RPN8/RPN11